MTSSNISSPANFTDNYPERGPWLAIGSPPPAFVNVQVLRPGGTTAYQFQSNDYFHVSMDVTLTANAISPRAKVSR